MIPTFTPGMATTPDHPPTAAAPRSGPPRRSLKAQLDEVLRNEANPASLPASVSVDGKPSVSSSPQSMSGSSPPDSAVKAPVLTLPPPIPRQVSVSAQPQPAAAPDSVGAPKPRKFVPVSDFIRAARDGDITTMEAYVACGGDVNAPTFGNWTALMTAAFHRQLGAMKYLLEQDATRCDDATLQGWTAVHFAVCKPPQASTAPATPTAAQNPDNPAALELLWESNADMNATTYRNWTALHIAVKCNHVSIVTWILRHRAVKRSIKLLDGSLTARAMAKEEGLTEIRKLFKTVKGKGGMSRIVEDEDGEDETPLGSPAARGGKAVNTSTPPVATPGPLRRQDTVPTLDAHATALINVVATLIPKLAASPARGCDSELDAMTTGILQSTMEAISSCGPAAVGTLLSKLLPVCDSMAKDALLRSCLPGEGCCDGLEEWAVGKQYSFGDLEGTVKSGQSVVVTVVPTVDFLEENPVVAAVCKESGVLSMRLCGASWRGNEADIPEFYDPNDEAEILNSLPLHSAVVPTLTRLSTTCNDIQAAFDQAGVDAVMPSDEVTVAIEPHYAQTLETWALQAAAGGFGDGGSVNGVSESRWRLVTLQCLDVLAFLREHHVMHGGVQASSFALTPDGAVMLRDFKHIRLLKLSPSEDDPQYRPIPVTDKRSATYGVTAACDPFVHHISRVGPPRWLDASEQLTMETLFDTADVYALGIALHNLLKQGNEPASSSRSPTRRRGDYQVPTLSECLSPKFAALLSGLVQPNPKHRLSAKAAWRALCCLCFGPLPTVTSSEECGVWLLKQAGDAALSAPGDILGRHKLQYIATSSPASVWEDVQLLNAAPRAIAKPDFEA